MKPLPRLLQGDPAAAQAWGAAWRDSLPETSVLLLLAATETAAVPGISAAGASPESRRTTAAADAELLVLGFATPLPHPLPPLPAGVSPALISQVVLEGLGIQPLVVDLGCAVAPAVPHLRLPPPAGAGPARCLSSGAAMERSRVDALLAQGRRWAVAAVPASSGGAPPPLLVAECVPGGTTTAQAVLTGLGIEAGGIVSGSLHRPAHALKADLVARGLAAAAAVVGAEGLGSVWGMPPDPLAVVAALGDPMQVLTAGLLLGAAETGQTVLLAGGSQMAAVLALALALAPPAKRSRLASLVAVGTTAWVAEEAGSDLTLLLRRIGNQWGVDPLAFAASLRFQGPLHTALLDYERGYVKEGVGAGGLAILWELAGRTPQSLALACDRACSTLLGPSLSPASCPRVAPSAGDPLRSADG